MSNKIKNTVLCFLILLFILTQGVTQTIIQHSNSTQKLKNRWKWAIKKSKGTEYKDGFWIGYSINRLMGENSYIGSFRSDRYEKEKSLAEIVYGKFTKPQQENLTDDQKVREAAKKVIEELENPNKPDEKIFKEIAFLFRFDRPSKDLNEIEVSNLSLHVDLDNFPLIWIGKTNDAESVNLLEKQYNKNLSDEVKEDLITAVALHKTSDQVVDFLSEIILDTEPNDVREKAVFWIGEHETNKTLKLLTKTAQRDRSTDVREKAVFSIYRMESEKANDVLVDLVYHANKRQVREKAIFWLGQKDSPKAAPILEDIAINDADRELQQKAIFGISQLKDNKSTNILIKLAKKHPNKESRKKAIFWLGQKASKKAAATLEDVAINDDDIEIQKKAIFALTQLDNDRGIPVLIKLAKTHSSRDVRKKAIFWLGQSDDPRALETLVQIVRKQ
jgi:HEAT repeat protein